MNNVKRCLIVAIAAALSSSAALAENWSHWRGPSFDGSSPEKNLPAKFSTTQNVKWTANMPGPAAATPIVHGDNIFVSSTNKKSQSLVALCIDRKSGKTKWSAHIANKYDKDSRSNFASPSPVTDGKHVFFFYGTGDLVCFTVSGNEVWRRNMQKAYGKFAFLWTFSTSPTLYKNRLYMQILQRDEPRSFLVALDPATGKELWKVHRPSKARSESLEAFTTPIPFNTGKREEILIAGGDALTGHDPATGKELWRWGTWNPRKIPHWRLVPSPVAGNGIVVACAPKGAPIYAVATNAKGTLKQSQTQWVSNDRGISSDVATPAFYKGALFVLNGERKVVTCINPKNGKTVWQKSLRSESKSILRASPTVADGKIYIMNHQATVFVLNAKNGNVIHKVSMGDNDKARASIVVSQGNLFIRTESKLYCIGKNPS